MGKRTLILLCPARCGSTAMLKVFQRHPDVGICHENPCVGNCEPHFWSTAAKAIAGKPDILIRKMENTLPHIPLPDEYTEESIFELWDKILNIQGPIVFDKSPFYLTNRDAVNLLYKYIQKGNDVRVFSLIRDPRDAITSQYELLTSQFEKNTLQKHEMIWLDQYTHLEEINKMIGFIPLFRYEDVAEAPSCYIPIILHYCGIRNLSYTYDHIKPVHIGRKATSLHFQVKKWKMSKTFKEHLMKYGYYDKNKNIVRDLLRFIRMLPGNTARLILSMIRTWNVRYYKKN
jgi:hypothetical protein